VHSILSQEQHGFRKHYPYETQLLTTIENFAVHVDSGAQIDAILLDFLWGFTGLG